MGAHTNVPLLGDRLYAEAISRVAGGKGITAGTLVRKALDDTYGNEIGQKVKEIKAERGVPLDSNGQIIVHSDDKISV